MTKSNIMSFIGAGIILSALGLLWIWPDIEPAGFVTIDEVISIDDINTEDEAPASTPEKAVATPTAAEAESTELEIEVIGGEI